MRPSRHAGDLSGKRSQSVHFPPRCPSCGGSTTSIENMSKKWGRRTTDDLRLKARLSRSVRQAHSSVKLLDNLSTLCGFDGCVGQNATAAKRVELAPGKDERRRTRPVAARSIRAVEIGLDGQCIPKGEARSKIYRLRYGMEGSAPRFESPATAGSCGDKAAISRNQFRMPLTDRSGRCRGRHACVGGSQLRFPGL